MCLISCKIANLTKDTRGTVTAHIMWAAYPCVYSGVWRYLQESGMGSPLFLYKIILCLTPLTVCHRRTLMKFAMKKFLKILGIQVPVISLASCSNNCSWSESLHKYIKES